MKIIAIVNGGFALPTLRALKDSRHEITALFVMPLRTKRSGEKAGVPPVREAIKDFLSDVPLYEPENVNSPESIETLKGLNADIIFICDYGKILSNDVLQTTRLGGINLHGSLLPKYRGAAPINRAIQNGERELGVSVIFIEPKVDAGPVIGTSSYFPSLEDSAVEIENRLSKMGAPLVLDVLDRIENNTVEEVIQNSADSSKAPKLRKEEGRIDWSLSSEKIIDQFRAFQPWPRVYSDLRRGSTNDSPLRLILGPFSLVDSAGNAPIIDKKTLESAEVGTVVLTSRTDFWIKTGDGLLRVLAVQPAGKKNMSSEVFLRGYRLQAGDRLI